MHADHQAHNPPPIAPPIPGGTIYPPALTAPLPARPTTPNPGTFEITSTWSKKEQSHQKEFYSQKLYLCHYLINLEQTCLLDLQEAISKELFVNLLDNVDTLIIPIVQSLLDFMEITYSNITPTNIETITETFIAPYDDLLTLPQYFKRQQGCQSSLKKTAEPISTATIIHTFYGQFQRIPHLAKACNDWDDIAHTTPAHNWILFKRHFNNKMRQYNTRQHSLASAGIAQMAYTPAAPPPLQSELAYTLEAPPAL